MAISFARNLFTGLRRRSLGANVSYVLGRFYFVRRAYSKMRAVSQPRPKRALRSAAESVFPPVDVDEAVRSIQSSALFAKLRLPRELVEELTAYAKKTPLRPPSKSYTFMYDEVKEGRAPNGDHAILAVVVGADQHPAVQRIARDPQVRKIVTRCLGYEPAAASSIRLVWSFVSSASDEERAAAAQTIAYHFDVHDYNFIYANYYITECDARSGAHAMILSSHRDKRFRWLLGSVKQERDALLRHYGADNELVIEGDAGHGFIQDASCYHKALAPVDRERLMLQIRYC